MMNLSTRTKAIYALVLTGILGGIAPLLMKIALKEFSSIQIVFVRFGLASLLVIPLLRYHHKSISFKKLTQTLPAGLLFSGNIFFMIIGLQYTTSIVSQLFYLLTPVFVSLIGYILFREKISARRVLSMIVCFAGSTLLILRSIGSSNLIHSIGTSKGNILIVCAVTSWSLYVIYTKRISKQIEPTFFLVMNFFTALAISIIVLMVNNVSLFNTLLRLSHSSYPVMASLVFLGVINSVIFFFLYQWSLTQVSAFIVASTTYLSPLAAAVFAIPFFGEQLSGVLLLFCYNVTITH
jgi:drug/metabolite transporter (DMT)-like permease